MNMVERASGANQPSVFLLHDAANNSKEIVLPVRSNPWLSPGSAPNEVNEQTQMFSGHRVTIIMTVAMQLFLHRMTDSIEQA